jgi:hypothetical protein
MHWAVFDFAAKTMYFAVASIPDPNNNGTITNAYDRQPFVMDMGAAFAMQLSDY